MFINKLNQVYKPGRILYYIEADDDAIRDLRKGRVSEALSKYANSYGTYDQAGVFYVSALEQPVIGIEYRADDERIVYPQDLKSIRLEGAFYYSVVVDDDIHITMEYINELFDIIAKDDDAHRIHSDLTIASKSDVISVFNDNKKIRILYEAKIDRERASDIIAGDIDRLDKKLLYELAFFDPITGHHIWNNLLAYIEMPMKKGIKDYAFVHFDIKEFKVINEVYGHEAANNVLRRVVRAMNDSAFVYASARCHNDNFAMMIKDMPDEEALAVLRGFFDGLSQLDEDPDYKIYYRCGYVPMQKSILLGNRVADAGKLAQSLGVRHNETEIMMYTDQMHDDISWGNYIKAYLDTAIRQDEFEVYMQPKIDIHKEEIEGAEALIRWNYRNKEFLSPGRFIPFFEKDGSIGKIDDIVLKKVCKAFAKWKREGRKLYPVSVNLSRNRLHDKNLTEHLTEIVDSYGVEHDLIDFELTESATYDDREYMISVLHDLRRRGFKISMDDFGTGYSSLSLLTEMPIDTLKIDKSFVDKLGTDNERGEDIVVIRHIITLAGELGFACLAEGAESKAQVKRLRELGCGIIQGYYYSRPIPVDEFEKKYIVN